MQVLSAEPRELPPGPGIAAHGASSGVRSSWPGKGKPGFATPGDPPSLISLLAKPPNDLLETSSLHFSFSTCLPKRCPAAALSVHPGRPSVPSHQHVCPPSLQQTQGSLDPGRRFTEKWNNVLLSRQKTI